MAKAAVALENRRFKLGRGHLAVLGIVVVAVWLVFVFGRALGDLDRAGARHDQVRDEAAALEQRLAADRREFELVQTDGFQALQARSFGMGAPGEQIFSLEAGAPRPEPVVPLGGAPLAAGPTTPLDAWLELLFGS